MKFVKLEIEIPEYIYKGFTEFVHRFSRDDAIILHSAVCNGKVIGYTEEVGCCCEEKKDE